MEVKIAIKPLSVNEAFKGRRFKTDKYKNYEQELLYRLPVQNLPKPPYQIIYKFGMSKNSDWDNPIKATTDILCKKYGFDDRDIYEGVVRKVVVKKGEEFIKVVINHFVI